MSREKLLEAKHLISNHEYDKARKLLKSLKGNPTAQEWLEKLDKIAPEKTSRPAPKSRGNRHLLSGLLMLILGFILGFGIA